MGVKVTEVRAVALRKADPPIEVTESGMATEPVQPVWAVTTVLTIVIDPLVEQFTV